MTDDRKRPSTRFRDRAYMLFCALPAWAVWSVIALWDHDTKTLALTQIITLLSAGSYSLGYCAGWDKRGKGSSAPSQAVTHARRGMGAEDFCTCDKPWPHP